MGVQLPKQYREEHVFLLVSHCILPCKSKFLMVKGMLILTISSRFIIVDFSYRWWRELRTCRGHFTPSQTLWKFLLELFLSLLTVLRIKIYCSRKSGKLSVQDIFYLLASAGLWPKVAVRAKMQHSIAGEQDVTVFLPFFFFFAWAACLLPRYSFVRVIQNG